MLSNKYTSFEGFTNTYGYNTDLTIETRDPNVLTPNVNAINNMGSELSSYNAIMQKNTDNISKSVDTYDSKRSILMINNSLYDYSGDTFFYSNRDKKTEDVILDDTNELLLQQNMMYITGSIAAVSLLIVALILGSK